MKDARRLDCPHPWFHIALLLNRIAIGLYLLLAGTGKLNDGLVEFVNESFKKMQPGWLPDALALPYAYALPFLEIVFGALLILGFLSRTSAAISGLMILSFTIAIATQESLLEHGPGPFSANLIFITLLFLLFVTGPGNLSIDQRLFKAKTIKK